MITIKNLNSSAEFEYSDNNVKCNGSFNFTGSNNVKNIWMNFSVDDEYIGNANANIDNIDNPNYNINAQSSSNMILIAQNIDSVINELKEKIQLI